MKAEVEKGDEEGEGAGSGIQPSLFFFSLLAAGPLRGHTVASLTQSHTHTHTHTYTQSLRCDAGHRRRSQAACDAHSPAAGRPAGLCRLLGRYALPLLPPHGGARRLGGGEPRQGEGFCVCVCVHVGVRDLVARGYVIPGGASQRGGGRAPMFQCRTLSDLIGHDRT